jgi:hypothetical protein
VPALPRPWDDYTKNLGSFQGGNLTSIVDPSPFAAGCRSPFAMVEDKMPSDVYIGEIRANSRHGPHKTSSTFAVDLL